MDEWKAQTLGSLFHRGGGRRLHEKKLSIAVIIVLFIHKHYNIRYFELLYKLFCMLDSQYCYLKNLLKGLYSKSGNTEIAQKAS